MGTELASEMTPQARGDALPHPSEVEPSPAPATHPGFQLLRKLLRLGNSYAVTIPDVWVKANVNPRLPYLTTTPNDDGSITLRAFNPNIRSGAP
jgi:hypothetical protein